MKPSKEPLSKRYAYNPDIEHIPDDQTGQGSRLCGQNVTPANLGPAKVSVAISSAPHISLQGDDDDAFDWTDEGAEDFASEHFSEDEVDLLAETGQSHSVDPTEEHRRCFCEPRMRHMLTGRDNQPGDNWEALRERLPAVLKWDTEYEVTSPLHEGHGAWTCAPLEASRLLSVPLTIGNAPVVIPVDYHWPLEGGVQPPPDPRPSTPIDCRATLPFEVVLDIFNTYIGSVGFYVLVNGLLQIMVQEDFDTEWASSHLPHKFGGLKVCYIEYNLEPTASLVSTTTSSRTTSPDRVQNRSLSNMLRPSRTNTYSVPLQLNDSIEARGKSSHGHRYAGKIGLRVEKNGVPYLVMSSHVITEAILAKSLFASSAVPVERLRGDWNYQMELWAGNARVSGLLEVYRGMLTCDIGRRDGKDVRPRRHQLSQRFPP